MAIQNLNREPTVSESKNLKSLKGLTAEAAPRLPLSEYQNKAKGTKEAVLKTIEDGEKMTLAAFMAMAKSPALGEGKGDDTLGRMADNMARIGQLRIERAKVELSFETMEAMSNPGFSATDLQDSIVGYDDSIRLYEGDHKPEFDFELKFDQKYKGSEVKAQITIYDQNDKVIHRKQVPGVLGQQSYKWDYRDSEGKKVEEGEYRIEVEATGLSKNGTNFSVNTLTNKTAKVSGVETKNGRATNIILDNNKIISRSAVTVAYGKANEIVDDFKVDPSMIGKIAMIDLAKFQVKEGVAKLSYNNDLDGFTESRIDIYDERGVIVKRLENLEGLEFGLARLELNYEELGLEDGKYRADIKLLEHPSEKWKSVSGDFEILVKGIVFNGNMVIDQYNQQFEAHKISSIKGDIMSPLENAQSVLLGKTVAYKDDIKTKMPFQDISFVHHIPIPEEGVLDSSHVYFYDLEDNLVHIEKSRFDALNILNMEQQTEFNKRLQEQHSNKYKENYAGDFQYFSYYDLDDADRANANKQIMDIIQNDKESIAQDKQEAFAAGQVAFYYSWNGEYNNGLISEELEKRQANSGDQYKIEFKNLLIKDGKIVEGEADFLISKATVSEVEGEIGGEIYVVLDNGRKIAYNQLLSLDE